jgi:hypothetical protein
MVTSFVILLATVLGMCAAPPWWAQVCAGESAAASAADEGRRDIAPGEVVVVIADGAEVMMGREVVKRLAAGTKIPVNRVDGDWIGTQIEVQGEQRGGWVKRSDVRLVKVAARATTEAAEAALAGAAEDQTADGHEPAAPGTEPQPRFDIDVIVILSDAEMARIDRTARINKLKLTGPGVSNAALKDVRDLASVNLLSIENTQITNAGLGLLADASNVHSLRLWQRDLDDSGLKQVKKLPALEGLDLEGTSVAGEDLDQLKDLANLHSLVLGPATGDAQMAALGNLPALEELDMRSCRNLSDAGIAQLGRITQLKTIWLPQQATDEVASRLMQNLPNCTIER